MRWTHFILLQCLLVAIIGGIVYLHKDRVILLKAPPASLAQWYKPDNERQVWLHTMFNLRREMQAARLYADNNDAEHLEKWASRLSEHYLKIGEMVPEWQKYLDIDAINNLQKNVSESRYQAVLESLDDLEESCNSCHVDYRAVTATMYRAPDFYAMSINDSTSLEMHMQALTRQINRIKIASEDGKPGIALASVADLDKGMNALGETCSDCHKKDTRVYPDETINKTLTSLAESLKTGTPKDQGRELGTLAVLACARCHGTHRIPYDSMKTFTDRPDWRELIKH